MTARERIDRIARQLRKPSSELQGDEVGVQVTAIVAGAALTGLLAAFGAAPSAYLPVAGAALVIAAGATGLALLKDRWERPYGDFLSTSVAVPSQDHVRDNGEFLFRAGEGEVCELHEIGHIGRMGRLSRQGITGRLTLILETIEGLLALSHDLDDPWYAKVTHIIGRADFTAILFKIGFEEITDPPRYTFYNRAEKRVLMWVIGMRIGSKRNGDSSTYRMAVVTKERFQSDEMRAKLEGLVARTRRDIERAGGR